MGFDAPPVAQFPRLDRLRRTGCPACPGLPLRGGTLLKRLGVFTSWIALAVHASEPTPPAAAAVPTLIEAGTPSFVVLGPESLGLSSSPTDIHVLPDGRTLVVAAQELAIGDGVRWETFDRAPDTPRVELNQVAVDAAGAIYASGTDHFARIEFGGDARWHFTNVAAFPPELRGSNRALARVSAASGEWYWTAGNGALVKWRPGQTAKTLGFLNDFERVLPVGQSVFVSDPSTGAIFRIKGDTLEGYNTPAERLVSRAIVSSVPLPDGRVIVGTYSAGAQIFDGRGSRALTDRGPLAGRSRVAELCAAGGGFYCAALDNLGLVFFTPEGRVVQVMDRSVDHRIGRVRRLLPAPGGGVWALLNDGIAQVELPSRLTHLESQVTTGLTYAHLCRHEGRLWLLADGQVQRGVYDNDGRLLRFEVDTPEPFANTVLSAGGRLVVATAHGVFQRMGTDWRLIAPDIIDGLLCAVAEDPDRWLVVSQGEMYWLRFAPSGPAIERFPAPGLTNSYGIILQARGAFWSELGVGRIARIAPDADGRLHVRIFGKEDGLPPTWVQAFLVDDVMRFNLAGRIFRYDDATEHIVPDREFPQNAPGIVGPEGRPMRDTRGRLWITTAEKVCVLSDRDNPTGSESIERMPAAFRPFTFMMGDRGVVWMHRPQQLVRFDPAIPKVEPPPLRAVISHVQLPASNRHWVFLGPELPVLDYRDNSLVAHFLAPNTVFGNPVTFEVMLDGTGGTWAPTGPAGSAAFSGLKEGHYVMHVRPRSGASLGEEATLGFSIQPPWFRTPLAYGVYLLAALILLAGLAGGWTLLARREQARLARLVAARTAALRHSEERYRKLNEELEQRVDQRTAELHRANERLVETNHELEAFSYSVSHDLRAPLRNISGFSDLLLRRIASSLDVEGRRFLSIVSTEAIRLGQLIDSLLAFSRLNQTELKQDRIDPRSRAPGTRPRAAGPRD